MRGDHPFYMCSTSALILFFTFFYVSITFNPTEVADNMKQLRRLHPGYPGRATHGRVPRLRPDPHHRAGAIYLALDLAHPAHRPVLVNANQNFPFGGTSILIIVGVGLETVKQIEAQLQQRHYEGFLR